MTRTPAQAIAVIQSEIRNHTDIGVGECQKNAHEVYGIGPGAATAYIAWLNAKFKHTDLATAPVGAWIFLSGGSTLVDGHPAGHVVINAGNGKVYSPGAPSDPNHWVLTTLAAIIAGWPGHVVVGWTEDNNGVRVPGLAPLAVNPPAPKKAPATPNIDKAVVATEAAVAANSGVRKRSLRNALRILKRWSTKY